MEYIHVILIQKKRYEDCNDGMIYRPNKIIHTFPWVVSTVQVIDVSIQVKKSWAGRKTVNKW
jgi:hypothetical protein